MPNQDNFLSDVTTTADIRYLASRIVQFPTDEIFLTDEAGSFGYDAEDNLEVHFYTIPGNQLLLSLTARVTDGVIKNHIVSYADGTYKNYVQIDFTKLFELNNATLIPGDYRTTFNFFSDEIGSYANRKLTIETISESRTEVEAVFNDVIDEVSKKVDEKLLFEFVEKGFARVDAVGVAEKIFKSGVTLRNSDEGLTAENVLANIEIPETGQSAENTIDRIDQLGLGVQFRNEVNNFIVYLYQYVANKLIAGDERIQPQEYDQIINEVVKEQIKNFARTFDNRISVT